MKAFRPETCPVQAKFAATRKELSAALIERDEEVDLVLTALAAQEHVLLVGPPGTPRPLLLPPAGARLPRKGCRLPGGSAAPAGRRPAGGRTRDVAGRRDQGGARAWTVRSCSSCST